MKEDRDLHLKAFAGFVGLVIVFGLICLAVRFAAWFFWDPDVWYEFKILLPAVVLWMIPMTILTKRETERKLRIEAEKQQAAADAIQQMLTRGRS